MPRGKRKPITPIDSNAPVRAEFFGESFAYESRKNELFASAENPSRLNGPNGINSGLSTMYDRYEQIYKGLNPFNIVMGGGGMYADPKQIVELCQKAYFNVSIFRNTIDIMTEFANSEVFFKGGNAKTRKFFENWFYNKIGGYNLADQFFREWFRSGDVIMYRFDADVTLEQLKRINNLYGGEGDSKMSLPVKYLMMNPAELCTEVGLNFLSGVYFKVLSPYELAKIKNAKTEEEKDFARSLLKDIQEKNSIDIGNSVLMRLDPKRTYVYFCKKQDYEPFAVPVFFPVLEDIDLKLHLKRLEKIICRTVEYVILLVKVGTVEEPNPVAMAAVKEAFRNEAIGRVLVADQSTDMEFIIPDINKVLGPQKYQQVNEDIANGLMNIFYGNDKFAATSIKIQVFMERLKEARKSFLEFFLNPEIKRISDTLGFKNYPKAYMADFNLEDRTALAKVTTRLGEIGILTPDEVIENLQTGYLPTPEESLESQTKFKGYRDNELYVPIIGGSTKDEEGRPTGSGTPQTTKKVSPIGTKSSIDDISEKFSLEKFVETLKGTNTLYSSLEKEAKKQFKVKKLSENQKESLNSIIPLIIANEKPENWNASVKEYVISPKPISEENGNKVDGIMSKYDTSLFLASVLSHCGK